MKNLILVVVAALALIAAWWVATERRPETDISRAPLLPELIDRVNDVAAVHLESARDSVALRRDASGDWVVETSDGYPADFERVKRLVLTLAEMKIVEPKTRVADRYDRIGVSALDDDGSRATSVTLMDAAGEPIASLLVGDASDGAATPGHYVRRPDAAQSYLVTGTFDYQAADRDWMDRTVVDIQPDRITRVEIEPAEGEAYALSRDAGEDGELALVDLPDGMQERSRATTKSIGSFLAGLRFDDVKAAASTALPAPAMSATFVTDAGGVVEATGYELDGERVFTLEASYDASRALAGTDEAPAADAPEAENPMAGMMGAPDDPGTPLESGDDASALNARLAPWVFVLPEFKRSMVARGRDELIQPVPERAEVGDAPSNAPTQAENSAAGSGLENR